jgi:hypothetical protein
MQGIAFPDKPSTSRGLNNEEKSRKMRKTHLLTVLAFVASGGVPEPATQQPPKWIELSSHQR